MVNYKVRGSRKTNGSKYGRGSSHQGATTRYLTRIIIYLSEVGKKCNQTNIVNACFSGNSQSSRSSKDAIQWLLSNKIILYDKDNSHVRLFYINPNFTKLKTTQIAEETQ